MQQHQRKRFWWLPYVVLEFDKNEILIDGMGGDLTNPLWNYRADLCVILSLHSNVLSNHPSSIFPPTAMCRVPPTSQSHPIYEQQ
jgi:hypothetical protein